MGESIKLKKENIEKNEEKLDKNDFLIFQPPIKELIFTKKELNKILTELQGLIIPQNLSTVQKSQWVKIKIIELMGYKRPKGLRTKQAKKYKPKFINQLLDIFVQSSSNLQIWNYIPYDDNLIPAEWNSSIKFSDCRYIIVMHNKEGKIGKTFIKEGFELSKWDTTGTKTIKWQANAPNGLRSSSKLICGSIDPIFDQIKNIKTLQEKRGVIKDLDKNPQNPLIKQSPNYNYLLTLNELCELISPLQNITFDNLGSGQERVIGQILEKKITEVLGYNYYTRTDTGSFPDLLNQLLEIKFQYSGTIDLGKSLPTDPKPIDFSWNDLGISNQEIRYCIFLTDLKDDQFITESILIVSGKEFPNYCNICAGTNFKIQLPIPKSYL
ncbi:hypothetical protein DSECCO2_578890 [anaerobic digester metagenome]